MSRKAINFILTCLLCLPPKLSFTQTLSRLEFWFDDAFSIRKTVNLSGSDVTVERSIDTDELDNGLHKFNFRVSRSDGRYSAISTSLFFKQNDNVGEVLEYWIDDDYDHRVSMELSGTTDEQELTFDLSDSELYPLGFHLLNFRVATGGKGMSAVYTTGILKIPSGAASQVEYWFDDDIAESKLLSGHLSSDKTAYIINTNIDVSQLSVGMHRLNYRACDKENNYYGALHSTPIMKVPSGTASQVEYWFDDDIADSKILNGHLSSDKTAYIINTNIDVSRLSVGMHRLNYRACDKKNNFYGAVISAPIFKVPSGGTSILEYWLDGDMKTQKQITSSATSGEYMFTQDLDLGAITSGHHRLYIRARSSDGKRVTAVTSVPIIVKSRYDQDYFLNANIIGYSLSVDNEVPVAQDFFNPRSELVMSHVLDARNLSTGNHVVKAKFWNSAYAGVSLEQQFNVPSFNEPTLTLNAEEERGLVRLKFDAVPNDLRYRIIRIDSNGARAKVDSKEGSSYPAIVSFTDNPAAGDYTYYVEIVYIDFQGEKHKLTSNEVNIKVTSPQTEETVAEEFGYITGSIICDKNTPIYGLKINYSDGVTENVNVTHFGRIRIPVGTQLTLTVSGDDTHEYESKTIEIKAGANDVILHGTLRDDYHPSNLQNDLVINSQLELVVEDGKTYAKFKVKNTYSSKWKGLVRVKAIDKKKADKRGDVTSLISYEESNYFQGESAVMEYGYNVTKDLEIQLQDLQPKEDTEFYFYFESTGKWMDSNEPDETKPLAISGSYASVTNPMVATITGTASDPMAWTKETSEQFAYFMLGLSSLVKGVDGNVGDLSVFYYAILSAAKELTGKYSADEAINDLYNIIEKILERKTVLELLHNTTIVNAISAIYGIYTTIGPTYAQKYWKDILGAAYDYPSAHLMLSNFITIAKAVETDSPIEATLLSSNIIYSLIYSGTPVPYASMMYSYMVVGKAMVAKLLEYADIVNGRYIVARLKANRSYSSDDDSRQNTAVDFKLIVKKKNLIGSSVIDFRDSDASRQIKSISIKVAHKKGQEPAEFSFSPVFLKDCVMLKTDGKGITNGKQLDDFNEICELYMEINWTNGRKTLIPLNVKTEGVDIDFNGIINESHFEKYKPIVYTVTLTTTTGKDNMADEFYLGTNKERK